MKTNRGYVRKSFAYLKKYGWRGFCRQVRCLGKGKKIKYETWFSAQRTGKEELERQRGHVFSVRPRISIVLSSGVEKTDHLRELLGTIQEQSYTDWEVCLTAADDVVRTWLPAYGQGDPRIRYEGFPEVPDRSAAGNAALQMASGEYILFCGQDALLEGDILFEIVKKIRERPETDIIYTDEDTVDEDGMRHQDPRFKPDHNPDLLCCFNYIGQSFAVRRAFLDDVGGFRKGYTDAQEWDLLLRCCEKTENIVHIPKVLYHGRRPAVPEGAVQDRDAQHAGKKAVLDHFAREGIHAVIEETESGGFFRPLLQERSRDKVSVIICNKDAVETLRKCVGSIQRRSTYDNYEIVIVENNSTDPQTFACYEELKRSSENIRIVYYKGEFHYSKVNNFGAKHAAGEYLILLNNDTEVITPDWIERMLGYCQRNNTAIVGAKLYYPDMTVQHCGVVIGMGGFAGHVHCGAGRKETGEMGRLQTVMDVSAVTGACLMIKRSVFDAVGGLDEEFRISLNDIDLCLKARDRGYLVVMHPGVELLHYESKSRGYEDTEEKQARFKKEIRRFLKKWETVLQAGDPYYSPNLTLMYDDCRIRLPKEQFNTIEEIKYEDRTAKNETDT